MARRRGYLVEDAPLEFRVGAKDDARPGETYPYQGPVAHVYADDKWLVICTDDYEGHAMLNIEALPYLRRALAKIDKARKQRS